MNITNIITNDIVTGKIAHLKFINVNKAMKSLLTSLLFYTVFLLEFLCSQNFTKLCNSLVHHKKP